MGRDRCLFCGRFIFEGDDVTRPPSLGLPVHRHCYLRDAGLEGNDDAAHHGDEWKKDSEEDEYSEDSGL
jgi:hypothetical protein